MLLDRETEVQTQMDHLHETRIFVADEELMAAIAGSEMNFGWNILREIVRRTVPVQHRVLLSEVLLVKSNHPQQKTILSQNVVRKTD